MASLKYNGGRRVRDRDLGIDFSDIHQRHIGGVDVNKLENLAKVYINDSKNPEFVFIKSRKVFRVYRNDPNWYLHIEDSPVKCKLV